ncbi:hypothetical protein [Pseudomonas mosselii]|uniref:hypothetical protein n=1 Tax=Pseudomonas mosselii TaxID=78327 RepID=UPI000D9A7271|nr:hypothetical protein [Pseudomonas mosselii]PYC28637.1 hypothetical protein DMX06_00230 [Pseudomonas mosselii]
MNPLGSTLFSGVQQTQAPMLAHNDKHATEFQANLAGDQASEQACAELTQQMNLQVLAMAMDLLNDSFTVEGGS